MEPREVKQSLLQVENLKVGFLKKKDWVIALDEISFELKKGETLALLGESGCGKSLTASALTRLLPKNAYFGQESCIDYEGHSLLDVPLSQMEQLRGRKIAMIFQEPMTALNPVMTIQEQLEEAIAHLNLRGAVKEEKMIALLREVELSDATMRLKQYPHQLSGGQRQRVVIAMALALEPDLLIADEPTTALDVTVQGQILRLLKALQQRYQMSMLFITHDLNVVRSIAHRVCVMYAGQVVEMATKEAFFASPKHPYSLELLASTPSFERRGLRLQVIPGRVPSLTEMPQGCRFHPRCPHQFTTCHVQNPPLYGKDHSVKCHLYQDDSNKTLHRAMKHEPWGAPSADGECVLQVHDVHVYFDKPRRHFLAKKDAFHAVKGVSFALQSGQTLALVGESGSGKTTVGRAILRLIPFQKGEVICFGQAVSTLKGHALYQFRRKVQFLFQDPYSSLNPRMTVSEILSEGIGRELRASARERLMLQLLDKVGLSREALSRYPHQFSGGQRSRIGLARALGSSPKVIICDEPTSALDVSVQAQILNLLKSLQHEEGLAYLFITHNMDVVSYMADEVMVMKAGQIVEHGPTDVILEHPRHPYTISLIADAEGLRA